MFDAYLRARQAAATLAVVASCGLFAGGPAWAGAGELVTVVTPLSPAVTYSVPGTTARPALATYIGYRVTVANVGGNTINDVRFVGATSVTEAREAAVFSSVEGAACSVGADGVSIDCALGQLKAGKRAPEFALFFAAPAKSPQSTLPDGNALDCVATDCVRFTGTTFYAEGTGGVDTSVPQNSTVTWAASPVTLGTFTPSLVRTALQKSGGTVFTGSGVGATPGDPFTTSVVVPAGATYTTAVVLETPDSVNCTNNFTACFRSDVTIPGTFSPYLSIVLRQDASTIRKGTKIESVLIQYTGAGGTVFVGDCASPTTPRSDGLPCVAKRTHYRNNKTPGWTAELDGDFEWTLINRNNGSYKVF